MMPQVIRRVLDDDVLDKTMKLFWQRGYFSVSVDDILQVTGFNRSAIYKHFGDKDGLFVAMLQRYKDQITPLLTAPLSDSERGLQAIEDFLNKLVAMHREGNMQHGCFLISTAADMPLHSNAVKEIIHQFHQYLTSLFIDIFEFLKKGSQIENPIESKAIADFMVANVFGLLSVCRMHVPTLAVENQIRVINSSLTALLKNQ